MAMLLPPPPAPPPGTAVLRYLLAMGVGWGVGSERSSSSSSSSSSSVRCIEPYDDVRMDDSSVDVRVSQVSVAARRSGFFCGRKSIRGVVDWTRGRGREGDGAWAGTGSRLLPVGLASPAVAAAAAAREAAVSALLDRSLSVCTDPARLVEAWAGTVLDRSWDEPGKETRTRLWRG